jgi:glutamate/tyrosine decarboxylase-like PLP-dependent enzyme
MTSGKDGDHDSRSYRADEVLLRIVQELPEPMPTCDAIDWRAQVVEFEPLIAELERFDATNESRPVIQPIAASSLFEHLPETLPEHGSPLADVYRQLAAVASEHARRNAHPGFWGYICGPGLPSDPAAHAWAAALNQIVTSQGSAPGAVVMERRLIAWMGELIGWDQHAGGLLIGGGSLANLSALAVALRSVPGCEDVGERGWSCLASEKWPLVYASQHAHFSVLRAMKLLGLGASRLRLIAADDNARMSIHALERAIASDRAAGFQPGCVVATAGTTAQGAIDPLARIAEICQRESVHMHVDAAYGGAVLFSEKLRSRLAGIEAADSVIIDLHKWGFSAFDASVVLYRRPAAARAAFAITSDYAAIADATSDEEFSFFHHGIETSRRARALPIMVGMMRYGRSAFAAWIENGVALIEYLRAIVEAHPRLQWVVGGDLSIACFRYVPAGEHWSTESIDRMAVNIAAALRAQGRFLLSATTHDNRPVLRVCIVNYSTRAQHIRDFVGEVLRLGGEFETAT